MSARQRPHRRQTAAVECEIVPRDSLAEPRGLELAQGRRVNVTFRNMDQAEKTPWVNTGRLDPIGPVPTAGREQSLIMEIVQFSRGVLPLR